MIETRPLTPSEPTEWSHAGLERLELKQLQHVVEICRAGSFSGAISASSYRNENELPKGSLRDALVGIFGAPEGETHQANDLFRILSQMPPEKAASLPFLYLDCGTEDELGLLAPNKMFADILLKRKIPHEFRELPGGHNWVLWNTQVLEFLQLTDKILNKPVPPAK